MWLNSLVQFLLGLFKVNIEAGGTRHEIVHISRCEDPYKLEICIPIVFTKHRRWPWSDELHSYHAYPEHLEWEKH